MGFKQKIKRFIVKNTPKSLINVYQDPSLENGTFDSFSNLSYSQEGEDLILKRIFEGQNSGYYVDVGAHHPKRFSNTYLFYKLGWRGINIDAMPGSMEIFKEIRPEDINLEIAVSDKEQTLVFHVFNEPALNTFDALIAEKFSLNKNFKIIEKRELKTFPLAEILNKYTPTGQRIDFMTIDVEGLDLKILHSINWSKHQPRIILIEDLNINIEKIFEGEIFKFLKPKGYSLFAKTCNTLIFLKEKWI